MRGIPLKPGIEAFPGPARRFFDCSKWDEFHVAIYADGSRTFIILDGKQLLQTEELGATILDAALNTSTGALIIATSETLSVFEATVNFNKPPQWTLKFEKHLSSISTVAWLDANKLVVGQEPSKLTVFALTDSELVPQIAIDPPTGGAQFAVNKANIFQHGSGLPKHWHLDSQTPRFDYIPHPTSIQWAQWINENLVTFSDDGVIRVWRSRPVANILYSLQCASNETPVVSQDRDALLIVVLSTSRTRYHRLSISSGLSVSEGARLPVNVNGQTIMRFDSPYLYAWDAAQASIDVYKCINWDPSVLRSFTGTESTKLYADGTGHYWTLGPQDLIKWGYGIDGTTRQDQVQVDGTTDIAVFEDTVVARATENSIEIGSQCMPSKDLLLLAAISKTEALAVFPSKIVFLPSKKTSSVDASLAAFSNGQLCLSKGEQVSVYSVDYNQEELQPQFDKQTETPPSTLAVTKDFIAYIQNDAVYIASATSTTELPSRSAHSLTFSPDGHFLALCVDDGLDIYCQARDSTFNTAWVCAREVRGIGKLNGMVWLDSDGALATFTDHGALYIVSAILKGDDYAEKLALFHGVAVDENLTLQSLFHALNGPLCLYDPVVILHLAVASCAPAIGKILVQLVHQLRFADVDSAGIARLDSSLGLSSADLVRVETDREAFEVSELRQRLESIRLPNITEESQIKLIELAAVFAEFSDNDLDHSAMAFVYMSAYYKASSAKAFIWALLSNSKGALLDKLPRRTWPSFYDEGYAYWLDHDQLAQELEDNARLQFAKDRNPAEVSLYYLALDKKAVLQSLWRVSAGNPEREKTMKLLGHDFSDERWKVAAQKNAYALMSKHRDEYAAALFLLGNSLGDCVQLLARKVNNLPLAVAVARVQEGDNGKIIQTISDRLLDQSDDWIMCWAQALQNKKPESRRMLSRTLDDPLKFWLLNNHLGGLSREDIERMKTIYGQGGCELLSEIVSTTISPQDTSKFESSTAKISDVSKPEEVESEREKTPETETEDAAKGEAAEGNAADTEEWHVPSNLKLKPAPTNIQLEPDMSAFGF